MIKYCRYYNEENKTENVVAYSTLDGMDKEVEEKHTFNGNKVLKFADTIEELCDMFITFDTKSNNHKIYACLVNAIEDYYFDVVFGAIWTDKGLIYVAKLNDRGVLELL